MTQDTVVTIMQSGLFTVMVVAAPPLVVGLTIGVIVSIFQAVTSIQEPTLAFVPKIIGVFMSLILFGSFMLSTLQDFIRSLYGNLAQYTIPMP